MSDCTNGGRGVYEENRLELTVRFTDGTGIEYVLNRVGREVDYIEVDGVRYERVRECELEINTDMTAVRCSRCGRSMPKGTDLTTVRYCCYCGAKVVKR